VLRPSSVRRRRRRLSVTLCIATLYADSSHKRDTGKVGKQTFIRSVIRTSQCVKCTVVKAVYILIEIVTFICWPEGEI